MAAQLGRRALRLHLTRRARAMALANTPARQSVPDA